MVKMDGKTIRVQLFSIWDRRTYFLLQPLLSEATSLGRRAIDMTMRSDLTAKYTWI
jgi:hypothetical protein